MEVFEARGSSGPTEQSGLKVDIPHARSGLEAASRVTVFARSRKKRLVSGRVSSDFPSKKAGEPVYKGGL